MNLWYTYLSSTVDISYLIYFNSILCNVVVLFRTNKCLWMCHMLFSLSIYRYVNGSRYIWAKNIKRLRNLNVYLKYYTYLEALKEIVNVSVIFEPSWTVFIPEDKLFKTSHNFYIFHSYFKYLYYLLTFNASKYRLQP